MKRISIVLILAILITGCIRCPYLVVAAYNSPTKLRLSADFICTGTNDEVTIQKAIDYAQSFSPRTLELQFCTGSYNLRDTVWCGYDFENYSGDPYDCSDPNTPAKRVHSPDIRSGSQTWFYWNGADDADKYIMVYASRHGGNEIGGLHFHGRNVSRGLLVFRNTYYGYMHDLRAYGTLGVGLDFVDCWGAVGVRLKASWVRGYGIRISGWNGGSLRDLQIGACRGYEVTDYPSDPDYVKNYAGNVAYPVGCEAALCVGGGGGTVFDIQIEANDYRTYPTVRIRASTKTFTNFRYEGGHDPGEGNRGIMKQSDYGIVIENSKGITLNDGGLGARHCYNKEVPKEQWTMLDNVYLKNCKNCVIRNVAGAGVRDAIVRIDSDCEDIGVERCYDRYWLSPSEGWPSPDYIVRVDDGAKRTVVDGQHLGWCRFGNGDRTPSVLPRMPGISPYLWHKWRFAPQTNTLGVIQFDDILEGYEFYVCRSTDGNTVTLEHNVTRINLIGGVNRELTIGEVLRFVVLNGVATQI